MKSILASVIIFVCFGLHAQVKLSERAEITIVTLGPYQGEVWSAFGHTGIRVYDPPNKINWFYNYGLYDFEQENFFVNFAKGLLKYRVGVGNYDNVVRYYGSQNRSIREQYLNLNQEEKQQFFDFLQNNIKPENAEYTYNYVYDNCATKIRDIAETLYPNRIVFDISYVEEGKTIRDLMDDYLDLQPWGEFGINLGLGQQIDQEAPGYDYMFLPDYIFNAFANATLKTDSVDVPLVSRTEVVFTPINDLSENTILTPLNVFIVLFFVVGFVTNRNFKTGKRSNWIDVLLFSFVGFIGLWVVFLWFGTEHLSKGNLNILWAIPLHLPIAFFINRAKFRKFMKIYFKATATWYCILLVIWVFLPQPLGMPLVPLVLAMVLRAFYIGYDFRKEVAG
ncbi:MAG: DUF4105 domain-containing protein [Cyclobacteriaceae bacterium]